MIMTEHRKESELLILKKCMVSDTALDEVISSGIKPDAFSGDHGKLFSIICQRYAEGKPVDSLSMQIALPEYSELIQYLTEDFYPAGGSLKTRLDIIKAESLRSNIEKLLNKCTFEIGSIDDPEGYLHNLQDQLFSITIQGASGAPSSLDKVMSDTLHTLEERHTSKALPGLSTGFQKLDRALGGFRAGRLVIIAGRASMGKTAFALSVILSVLFAGEKILVFSLEMTKEELVERLISFMSGYPLYKISSGLLNNDEYDQMVKHASDIANLPLFIQDRGGLTFPEIAAQARKAVRVDGVKMIVIDYLGLIRAERRAGQSKTDAIEQITTGLKALAKDLKVPVLLLCQLNREVENRPDHTPQLSDLRDSGAIEQDADAVLLLYRPSVYHEDQPEDEAHLIVAKNRGGPTLKIKMKFEKETAHFSEGVEF